MSVLLLASVLASLLSVSAAAPTTDDCSQLTEPLTTRDLHQILGRWILIEGFSNNEIFDSVLREIQSSWMTVNTTADNNTLVFDIGERKPLRENKTSEFRPCLRVAHKVNFVDNKTLEVRMEFVRSNHRFLQTCQDCMVMHIYMKEYYHQAFYLYGRNATIAASDLESFRKQAACLQFPSAATLLYDPSIGLCPV